MVNMKKGLIIAGICLAAMLVALPVACISVNAGKEKIMVTEEVIEGNPEAAEGIKLNMATHWKGHLLWETEYAIGSGDAVSEFEFDSVGVYWKEKLREDIATDYATDIGSVGASKASANAPTYDLGNIEWLPTLVMAVADRTGPGTTHTEELCLEDYYEYYPLRFHVDSKVKMVNYTNNQEEGVISSLFHVGIVPEDIIQISITKNNEGLINGFKIKKIEEDGYFGWTIEDAEVFGTDGCYYTYACTDLYTGEYLERGANRGIFYMPYEPYGSRLTIADEKIEKVCELEEGAIPVDMLLDEANSKLYLLVRDGKSHYMHIYKLNGYIPELISTVNVAIDSVNRPPASISVENSGILIKWGNNGFAFIVEEDGDYKTWCSGTFPQASADFGKIFPDEHAAWFDGERLVLAALKEWCGTDVQLVVYGREGQEYYGIYHYSYSIDDQFYGRFESDKIVPKGGTGGLSRAQGVEYVPIWLSE